MLGTELVEGVPCRPGLHVVVHILRLGDDDDIEVRFRAVDRAGVEPLRVGGVRLPFREQPVDVRVQQKDERVPERNVLPTHPDEPVHRVMRLLDEIAHVCVVDRGQDVVVRLHRCRDADNRSIHRQRRVRGVSRAVSVGACSRHVETRALPRVVDGSGGRASVAHEVRCKEIERAGCPAAQIRVRNRSRILRPVPVVQRELRVDLPQQVLQPIDDLPMPREELRSVVHVCRLMNLVLLEPPADPARDRVGSAPRVIPVVQLNERIPEQSALRRLNRRDIAPDTVSQGHGCFPFREQGRDVDRSRAGRPRRAD
jgi:hypothetical protein